MLGEWETSATSGSSGLLKYPHFPTSARATTTGPHSLQKGSGSYVTGAVRSATKVSTTTSVSGQCLNHLLPLQLNPQVSKSLFLAYISNCFFSLGHWASEATCELSKRGISVSYINLGPLDSVLLVFQAIQGIHLSNADPRARSVPNVRHQSLLSLRKKHLSGTPISIVCFHTRGGVFARWCLSLSYPS